MTFLAFEDTQMANICFYVVLIRGNCVFDYWENLWEIIFCLSTDKTEKEKTFFFLKNPNLSSFL